MKRRIAVLLLITTVVILVFGACAEKHDFGEWIGEVSATCETAGVKGHYHCSHCNKNFTDKKVEISDADLVIPAKGHTEVVDAAVAASCTETGKTEGSHCAVCGKVLSAQETVPATGHTPGEWVTDAEPTCAKVGIQHQSCTVCGKTIGFNQIPVTEHTFGEWIAATPETCGQDGAVAHYECTVCHKYFDAEYNELDSIAIPATGAHNYGEWIAEVPATKTESGEKAHYHCDGCGKNFDAEYNELEIYIPAEEDTGWSIVV